MSLNEVFRFQSHNSTTRILKLDKKTRQKITIRKKTRGVRVDLLSLLNYKMHRGKLTVIAHGIRAFIYQTVLYDYILRWGFWSNV